MKSVKSVEALLEKLNIQETNFGACSGPDGWIEDRGGRELVSYNPTNGQALARIIQATPAAYQTLMTRANRAFETWRLLPAPRRGQVIRDLGYALREMKEPLGELVSLEMGKIRVEGLGEVQEMIDICEFATGLARQLYGLVIASERPLHRMMEQWHPLGIVGVISAFNFPVAVWSWNTAIAAVAGDCVVWKPSSDVPLCAVAVQHITNRVAADYGLDGVFNLLIGRGSEVGELMLNDPAMPLISFTGSTSMGRHVSEAIARRFGRSILELGGNNAIIVTPHANLDLATRAILFGAVGTAGQRCTSTRRIIAHRSVAAALSDRLVRAYQQVRIGDPLDAGTLMGPLVNQGGVDDMMAALERVRAEGGVILTGGNRLPDKGALFVEPTIVKMPAQTPIVQEETFAPILYILEYDTLAEAIALHNGVPQGLSSSIFSTNMLEIETFLSAAGSDCGIANVNIGTSGAEIGGAFGGEKETGGGRESGSDVWKYYMRRQTNTINYSSELPLAQGIKFGE